METYQYTMWLMWPKAGDPGEIVRHLVDSLNHCLEVARYYESTIAADGVAHWTYTCTQFLGA